MKFPSVDAAQAWSTKYSRLIYVEVQGAAGVLQVYPGGRKVFIAANKGKIYERWRKRLTPDSVFDNDWPQCEHCGAFTGVDPHEPDCEEMSL